MNSRSLFVDKEPVFLDQTFVGGLLQRLYVPIVSEISIFVVIYLLFFAGTLSKIWNFDVSSLAPWFTVIALVFSDKSRIKLTRPTYWYIAFICFLVLSGLLAVLGGMNVRLIVLGIMLFSELGIAFIVGQTLRSSWVNNGLVALGLPLVAFSIYQFATQMKTPSAWVSPTEIGLTRVFATFGSPNILGILMCIFLVLALGMFLETRMAFYLIPAGLFMFTMLLTYSRTSWLAFSVALVLVIIIYNYKYLILSPLLLLGLLIPAVRARVTNALSSSYLMDASLDGRIWSSTNAFHILGKHPVLGTGPGTYGGQLAINYASPVYLQGIQNGYTALYYTDNQYLQLLIQSGVIGLLLFTGFVYSLYVKYIASYYKTKDLRNLTAVAVLTSFVVAGFFANVLEFGAVVVPVGLILGAAANEE